MNKTIYKHGGKSEQLQAHLNNSFFKTSSKAERVSVSPPGAGSSRAKVPPLTRLSHECAHPPHSLLDWHCEKPPLEAPQGWAGAHRSRRPFKIGFGLSHTKDEISQFCVPIEMSVVCWKEAESKTISIVVKIYVVATFELYCVEFWSPVVRKVVAELGKGAKKDNQNDHRLSTFFL